MTTTLITKFNPEPSTNSGRMALPIVTKALRYSGIGGSLQVLEEDIPQLPENEILVRVHAASINPVDIQLWRAGVVAVVAGSKGMGKDFSGTVVSVGQDVKKFTEGDDVYGLLFEVVCTLLLLACYAMLTSKQFGQGSVLIAFNPSLTHAFRVF